MKSNKPTREDLEAHKQAIVEGLPPFAEIVRGSIFERQIKCGKTTCRCVRGQGHPTTYLTVSFERGKTVQITVPKRMIPTVRNWVKNYAKLWDALEQVSEINRQLLRQRLLDAESNERSSERRRR